ncbi:hypothetical protein CPB83DRAFT_888560 [Crepidotus variabilis]|uniref:DUF6534 domain-containing protein n=1 Tax=Crepidotus variabilis TaxID=179855 RepID=A0A9P6ESS2_9AGAR|nr:hypothetical protein CPB83DRAFT_888560 [Crepidotus variabilis]
MAPTAANETLNLLVARASAPPQIVEVATTLFICYLIIWGLFGVLSAQVYLFFIAFPNELLSRQCIVYGLYCFELTQVIMLTVSGIQTFGSGWGDPAALDHIGTIFITIPLMTSIISMTLVAWVVQAFYAFRIAVLAETLWPPITVLVVATIGLGGGIATSVIGGRAHVFSKFLGTPTTISTAFWNGGAALCDVLIATLMLYFLGKRRGSPWKSTQDRVNRIVRLVIETGTLTALVAIANLVLSCLPSHPTYFQITSSIICKMYSNSMMVMLNSRMQIGRLAGNDLEDDGHGGNRISGNASYRRRPEVAAGHAEKASFFQRVLSTVMFASATENTQQSDYSGTRLKNDTKQEQSATGMNSQGPEVNVGDSWSVASNPSRIKVTQEESKDP